MRDAIVAVVIAFITTGGLVVVALIGRNVGRRVGKPNGRGNVIEMEEHQLDILMEIKEDMGELTGKIETMGTALMVHAMNPGAHDGRRTPGVPSDERRQETGSGSAARRQGKPPAPHHPASGG